MDYTVEHGGRVFAAMTQNQLVAHGVPADAIDAAMAEARGKAVSAECRRRIYAAASAETQMNMATAAAVISGKAADDRSDDENTILAGVSAALAWVTAMRANVDTLKTATAADYLSDAEWPDLPAEAASVVERY
ncbi:hypothetical protein AAFO90_23190 [Phaeobacter sp. CAU 1743]|uniref:hypothetical protein n=1 Tax=Phaeobacter sp. CAU 1743 TaxID=3140367 RepID=UPI0023B3B9BA